MTWLFAILVVLAMGGIAVVAAGRGAPMSQEYDDRPDALVPPRGSVSAEDLRRVRFSLAFRGYRMSEVDALLDRLAGQLDPHRGTGSTGADTGTDTGIDTGTGEQTSRERRGDGTPD